MPSRYWLVDDTTVELIDRGPVGVTLVVGSDRQVIPPMTIGSWPVPVAGRTVTLEAKRNLDVVRYQLVSDDHLVPRRNHAATRTVPSTGTACSAHATPAVTTCPRCARPYCGACAPDGNHCSACLHALVADERAAIKRLRWIGIGASLALMLVVIVVGVATHSRRVMGTGFAGAALVIVLSVQMLIRDQRASGNAP